MGLDRGNKFIEHATFSQVIAHDAMGRQTDLSVAISFAIVFAIVFVVGEKNVPRLHDVNRPVFG